MKAREFAEKAHGTQKYGDKPYVTHLDAVATWLRELGRADLENAGYLHDVLEDTKTTRAELETAFDSRTAERVAAVTNEP